MIHHGVMSIDADSLPDDPALLRQMLRELHAENDKLRLLIQRLARHQFGRRSEQLSEDQLLLGIEDLEQTAAEQQEAQDTAASAGERPPTPGPTRPARNRGALPAPLPRDEVVIDAAPGACPCCGGTMHRIGELRTEQLDFVPAQLRVRVTRRPRYACRACEGTVVVAPAPERPIAGGMPTEALIAHVVISKYCDSLPLYRQSQILARQGVALDRATLANWVGSACWWLMPLYELVIRTVLSSPKLFADKRLAGDREDQSVQLAFCWTHMRRASSSSTPRRNRRWRPRCWRASRRCMPSRRRFAAVPPSIGRRCGSNEVGPSWTRCMSGCWRMPSGSPAHPIWQKPYAMRSGIGLASFAFLMTVASRWTRTWLSARSGRTR